MNDRLYLVGVEIEGFRRFDVARNFQLSDRPGITILVGPNGSGKSTMLDAVEWALTGAASRLPGSGVTRSKKSPNVFRTLWSKTEPRVVLDFVDQHGNISRIEAGTSENRLADLLRRKAAPWNDMSSVATALRWTHFSSQRSTTRLGHEEGESVVEAIAGPAGLDRLQGTDRLLWSLETRKALAQRRETVEARLRRHELALEAVKRQVGGSDDEVRMRVSELIASVRKEVATDIVAADATQEELENALNSASTLGATQTAQLRLLTSDIRDASVSVRQLRADAEAAERTMASAAALSSHRKEQADNAADELQTAKTAVAGAESALGNLRLALAMHERRQELRLASTELRSNVSSRRREAEAAKNELERMRELVTQFAKLRAAQLLERMEDDEEKRRDSDAIEAERVAAEAALSALEARREELSRSREDAKAAAAAETERLGTLSSLAAALAERIGHDDEHCPLCSAAYPPGELLARARQALAAPTPGTTLSKFVNERTVELGRVSGQMQLAAARAETARSAMARLERWKAERTRLTNVLGAVWSRHLQTEIGERVLELRASLELADAASMSSAIAVAEQRSVRLDGEVAKAELALVAFGQESAILERDEPRLDEVHTRAEIRRASSTLEQALDRLRLARSEFDGAHSLMERAAGEAAAVTIRHDEALKALKQEEQRHAVLSAKLTDLLGDASIEEFAQSVQQRSVSVSAALERLAIFKAEFAASREQRPEEDLDYLHAAYLSDDGTATPSRLAAAVKRAVEGCQLELTALTSLTDRLRERARHRMNVDNEHRGTVLQPWNAMFKSVYASLAGSLGETLEWATARTDLRYSEPEASALPSIDGRSVAGWLAGHYFSEGQLAALQISAMITASVLLPWSRWRALLLDDPLQHADVIKVGAFADLIRSLCEDEGHQIILTTHDQMQADFIASKFRARDLHAQIIRFERLPPRPTRED